MRKKYGVFRVSRPYNMHRRQAKRDYGKALVIFYDVSKRRNIDARTLRDGASRWPHIVAARREFCLLAHREARLSYTVIADVLGFNHTSVYWHLLDDDRRRRQNRVRAKAYFERSRACRAA